MGGGHPRDLDDRGSITKPPLSLACAARTLGKSLGWSLDEMDGHNKDRCGW